VDEDVGGRQPVRHAFREALDPHALPVAETLPEPQSQLLVSAAETDDEVDLGEPESDLDRAGDVPDPPAAARDEDDSRVRRQVEPGTRLTLLARLAKGWIREAVDAVDLCRGACDPEHLRDRFRVRDEVDVGARRRPVPQRGEVGDRREQRDPQAAALSQPTEHLRRVRVRGDDDVWPSRGDETQEAWCSQPVEPSLRQATRRREPREGPEAEVPEPRRPVEEDARRALADGGDEAAQRY
jgi:hypothetical protein